MRTERIGREGADEAGRDPSGIRRRQRARDLHEGVGGTFEDGLHRAVAVVDAVQHRVGAVEEAPEPLEGRPRDRAGATRSRITVTIVLRSAVKARRFCQSI